MTVPSGIGPINLLVSIPFHSAQNCMNIRIPSGLVDMEYGGRRYPIVQGIEPNLWKWKVRLDEKTTISGEAQTRAAAVNSVWRIDNALTKNAKCSLFAFRRNRYRTHPLMLTGPTGFTALLAKRLRLPFNCTDVSAGHEQGLKEDTKVC
jgi:hypothetical protein